MDDPESLTLLRRYLGDRRFLFTLPRAVCLQMLHPAIATATIDHALHKEMIWAHKQRTVSQAIYIAFAERDMTPVIRFAHADVKGQLPAGGKYHALEPDLFHFQHATYVESLMTMVDTFLDPLDPDRRERLYLECCDWYRRYGVSARPMPDTWSDFGRYFDDYCRRELQSGGHFEAFRAEIFDPSYWWPRAVPRRAIRALQHPIAQKLADVRVTGADRLSLRVFTSTSRLLPPRSRV